MASLRSWIWAGVLFGALTWHAPAARADGGYGLGFGLVIGYSTNGSWSLGWEGGAAAGVTLLKLSVGGSYRLDANTLDPRVLHYVAYEPWLLVGGTIGVAFTEGEARAMYGAWEGVPIPLEGKLFGGDNSDDQHPQTTVFTIAIGWRAFGSTHQFYVTPKLWGYSTIELNS